jgi:cathepsin L
MSRVIIVAALVALAFCLASAATEQEYRVMFSKFMTDYSRTYRADQFKQRYNIFKQNYDFIQNYNAQKTGVVLDVNQFADLTNDEFRAQYLGFNVSLAEASGEAPEVPEATAPTASCPANSAIGATCDWRQAGAVTPIKNQGQCGSCWSFSTTGSTEGAHFLSTNNLVSLSEQNLVDCSKAEGNQGCNGGLMTQAFEYIIKNDGIDTEASYPYKGVDGTCKFSASNVGATISSYKSIATGSETSLASSASSIGPISVAIDASHSSFQFYRSGVYYEAACSSTQLDHGVLVVGLGTDSASNRDFYLVKNSWGPSWGESGYIQMSRNRNNNCGIATMASYPIV